MSADLREENAAYIRHGIEEMFNHGRFAVADERFADRIALHSPASEEPVVGRAEVVGFIRKLRTAFPDLHIVIEDLIADGDRVVTRCTTTGTHLGDYFGVPPTSRRVRMAEVQIFRVEDTRIQELWLTFNVLGVLQQMGMVPAGGLPPPVMKVLAYVQRQLVQRKGRSPR